MIYPSFQKSPIKPYENLFSHPFFFVVDFSSEGAHSNTKNICAESDFSALRGRPVINRTFASRYNSRIALNNEWITRFRPQSEPARSLLRDMYSTSFSQKQISREFHLSVCHYQTHRAPFSFHAHREVRRDGVDSAACTASTSAEATPARRPCVHQFKKVG